MVARGEPDRGAVLAADVTGRQPVAEPAAVGLAVRRQLKVYRAEATAALTEMMGHERDPAVLYRIGGQR
jgi:hypothetical protein